MSLRCLGFLFDSQRRRESGPCVGKTKSQQHFVWTKLAKKENWACKLKAKEFDTCSHANTKHMVFWEKKGAICYDAMAKPLTPASSRYRCLPSDERKKPWRGFLLVFWAEVDIRYEWVLAANTPAPPFSPGFYSSAVSIICHLFRLTFDHLGMLTITLTAVSLYCKCCPAFRPMVTRTDLG